MVHGGRRFTEPVLVSDEVVAALRTLAPLAPLHNPANVEGIVRAQVAFPGIPHVAVFDTGFHRTLPPEAYTYAVPPAWRDEHHVRRYGFHGSSYAWVARRTAALLGRDPADVRMVVLHLGNGASACAVDGGRSVETSMGLSPVEGLVMGTRSGDVDPALAGYLSRVAGLSAEDYDRALNRESGLLGLAGVSDFRTLEERRSAGDADAALAFDVTVHRLRKYVGAYAAVLGRLDALAFTGGIGERSPALRAAVVDGLGVLGLRLDPAANADGGGPAERLVSAPDSSARCGSCPPTRSGRSRGPPWRCSGCRTRSERPAGEQATPGRPGQARRWTGNGPCAVARPCSSRALSGLIACSWSAPPSSATPTRRSATCRDADGVQHRQLDERSTPLSRSATRTGAGIRERPASVERSTGAPRVRISPLIRRRQPEAARTLRSQSVSGP